MHESVLNSSSAANPVLDTTMVPPPPVPTSARPQSVTGVDMTKSGLLGFYAVSLMLGIGSDVIHYNDIHQRYLESAGVSSKASDPVYLALVGLIWCIVVAFLVLHSIVGSIVIYKVLGARQKCTAMGGWISDWPSHNEWDSLFAFATLKLPDNDAFSFCLFFRSSGRPTLYLPSGCSLLSERNLFRRA